MFDFWGEGGGEIGGDWDGGCDWSFEQYGAGWAESEQYIILMVLHVLGLSVLLILSILQEFFKKIKFHLLVNQRNTKSK